MELDDVDLDRVHLNCRDCAMHGRGGLDDDGFYVRVPLVERGEREPAMMATLHCQVTEDCHRVTLEMLSGADGSVVAPPESFLRDLDRTLGRIAEKRLCGSGRLCPETVTRLLHDERL